MNTDSEESDTVISPVRLFLNKIANSNEVKETYTENKKIWNINASDHPNDDTFSVIGIDDMLSLIEKVAENKIRELRFGCMELRDCYYDEYHDSPCPSIQKIYSGWTVRKIRITKCLIWIEFLTNVITENSY